MTDEQTRLITELLAEYAQVKLYAIYEGYVCTKNSSITDSCKEFREELKKMSQAFNVEEPVIDWSIYICEMEE